MLKDKKESRKYLVIIILIFLSVIIIGGIGTGIKLYSGLKDPSEIVNKYFEKITNNYSMNVKLYKGEEEYKLDYMSDGTIEMYSSNTFSKTGYLIYKGNYYCLDNNELKKISSIDINGMFNEKLYNINLIKELLNECHFETMDLIRAKCLLNTKMFFEKYNKVFDENIEVTDEEEVPIEILYNGNIIENLKIKYDNVVKKINQNDENIEYDIKFDDINKNDFSEYIPYIEKKN